MKNFFSLFIINLKDMWHNHKLVFILINLFMLCSYIFFMVSYNSVTYVQSNADMATYVFSTYTFNFDYNINIEDKCEGLDKLIKEEKNINSIFFHYDNAPDKVLHDEHGRPIDYKEIIYPVYYGQMLERPVASGRWFTEEEMKTGAKVVIVPNYDLAVKFEQGMFGDPVPHYEIGEKFVINGEEYTIIGETTSVEYVYMIPYNAFTNKNLLSSGVNISIKELYTEEKSEIFINKVNSYLDTTIKRKADVRVPELERIFRLMIYAILNITVINLAFIYSYLLKTRKEMIGLFKLYGLKKNKCALYLFFEYYIWILTNFIFSSIFTNIYFTIVRNNSNTMYKFFGYLNLKEYIYIFIAYSVIYFICFFPSIIRFIEKNQDITLINEGGIN